MSERQKTYFVQSWCNEITSVVRNHYVTLEKKNIARSQLIVENEKMVLF